MDTETDEVPEPSDDFPVAGDDSIETTELQTRQIAWLAKRIEALQDQNRALSEQVTEAAANIPTPESLAELAAQATAPTREAMERAMEELRALASPTPPSSEPEPQPTPPPPSDIKTTEPQEPPIVEENPAEAEPPQNPAPVKREATIRKV